MPAWISLSVTVGLLAAGVLYSLYRTRSHGPGAGTGPGWGAGADADSGPHAVKR